MKLFALLFVCLNMFSMQPHQSMFDRLQQFKQEKPDEPMPDAQLQIIQTNKGNLHITNMGKSDIILDIDRKDTPQSTPPQTSEDSEDTIPKHRHNKRMLVSNGVTAVICTGITAGVTLAIHFSNCKK